MRRTVLGAFRAEVLMNVGRSIVLHVCLAARRIRMIVMERRFASHHGIMSLESKSRKLYRPFGESLCRRRRCKSSIRTYYYVTPMLDRFSALKMDGKPLYEYARKGIPLPRPIEKRKVTVHELELVEWKGSEHSFRYPEKKFTEDQKKAVEAALSSVQQAAEVEDEPEQEVPDAQAPTAFVLRMKVSGGTYVRSIVHDLGHAVGSAAHVVTLTRTRQGRFALEPTEEADRGCVPWNIIEEAATEAGEKDAEGWTQWERAILDRLEIVE